jgi:hypothetical protein
MPGKTTRRPRTCPATNVVSLRQPLGVLHASVCAAQSEVLAETMRFKLSVPGAASGSA